MLRHNNYWFPYPHLKDETIIADDHANARQDGQSPAGGANAEAQAPVNLISVELDNLQEQIAAAAEK